MKVACSRASGQPKRGREERFAGQRRHGARCRLAPAGGSRLVSRAGALRSRPGSGTALPGRQPKFDICGNEYSEAGCFGVSHTSWDTRDDGHPRLFGVVWIEPRRAHL